MRIMTAVFMLLVVAIPASAQTPLPVIDMHPHASAADENGPPPLALCVPPLEHQVGDPRTQWGRRLYADGRFGVFAEVTNQYVGIGPSDPRFEPYLAVAEELDIPVGIHIGTGPPAAPYFGLEQYRAALHTPLTLEEALLRHPKLRVYIMHAGWPPIRSSSTAVCR